MPIKESELILNPDGSIYHLKLHPDQIAKNIITVGDPARVKEITKHFDNIECKVRSREFFTVTGTYGKKRITVISTGIGTDNIDIVFNELDALVNINLKKRVVKNKLTSLHIYRIGTSGSINKNIAVDSFVVSQAAVGLDGLMHYYKYPRNAYEKSIYTSLIQDYPWIQDFPFYVSKSSDKLSNKFKSEIWQKGITITANGFYNPQGRVLRLQSKFTKQLKKLHNKQINGLPLSNIEMETAGIYGLANLLGHKAVSLNAILANRSSGTFSKSPKKTIQTLIEKTLEKI